MNVFQFCNVYRVYSKFPGILAKKAPTYFAVYFFNFYSKKKKSVNETNCDLIFVQLNSRMYIVELTTIQNRIEKNPLFVLAPDVP